MKPQSTQARKSASSRFQAKASVAGREVKPTRILVPTDFSKPSLRALKAAADFARLYGGRITLLYVLEPPALPTLPTFPNAVKVGIWTAELRSQLEKLGRKHIDPEHYQRALVHYGKPVDEIVEAARVHKMDLIVIATHGYTGLQRVLLGSTAERVIRYAPCPVLTVHLEQKPGWPTSARTP